MDPARLLADALRRLRNDARLTQTDMAKRLGISQPTLNRLESASQNVTIRTLGRLCRALTCPPGDLFVPGRLRVPGRRRPRSR